MGLLHLQEALLSVRPYIRFFINSRIGSLIILCKHLCYFQAGGKQSDFLCPSSIFHLSVLTTMLDIRQAVPDRPVICESMPQLGAPKTHALLVPKA